MRLGALRAWHESCRRVWDVPCFCTDIGVRSRPLRRWASLGPEFNEQLDAGVVSFSPCSRDRPYMRHILFGFTILALATLSSAQSPSQLAAPSTPTTSEAESGAASAPRFSDLHPEFRSLQDRQEKDYSRRALFLEYHGAYLQKSRRYQPAISASWMTMPNATLNGEPGKFDLDRLRFDMTLPIPVDPDVVLYLGGRFGVRRYDFNNAVTGAQDDHYYEAGLNLGFGTFLTESLFLEGRFTPGVYSDWDTSLHTKDFKWYGGALLTGRVQDDLFLKVGFAYNGTFEQVPVYPRLGLAWAITPQFRFDMVLPEYIECSWLPSSAFVLSLGTECAGEQFRSHTSVGTGRVARKQQTQQLDLYLRGVIRFDDHFSIFGKLGTSYAGDNDFRDQTNAKFNGAMDWNPFLEVGVGIDF